MNIDLANMTAAVGSRFNGVEKSEQAGLLVHDVGDLNGDGFGDFVIAAPNAINGSVTLAGSAYVVFGTGDRLTQGVALNSLNGLNGFRIDGDLERAGLGWAVSSAGDFNGDGIDDLLISQPFLSTNGSPTSDRAFVIFGKTFGWASSINISSLAPGEGIKFSTNTGSSKVGSSVAGGGDINGDGISDIIIGASQYDIGSDNISGSAYVVFGSTSVTNMNLDTLNGSNGFRVNGVAHLSGFGEAASFIGDINRDGIGDFGISAPNVGAAGFNGSGFVYIFFGKSTPWASSFSVSSLDGSNGFRLEGAVANDRLGRDIAAAGDVNGDGIDDLIVGAPGRDGLPFFDNGAAYVIFGKSSAWNANFNINSLNGMNGFSVIGSFSGLRAGSAVDGAGDVNGDGLGDIVIGLPGSSFSGQGYVVFGSAGPWPAVLEGGSIANSVGFRVSGPSSTGSSVSGAGDVNGDGFADVLFGAPLSSPSPELEGAGAAFLVYGRATGAINRIGTSAADFFAGGDFDDSLSGLGGNDRLIGGGGNDTLEGGPGADTLSGGDGLDWANYFNAAQRVIVFVDNPGASQGDAQGDLLSSIEYWNLSNLATSGDTFFGSNVPEFVFGQLGNDILFGNGGNDSLYGGAGDDFLLGGAGADGFFGESGFDAVFYGDSTLGLTIDLVTPESNTGFALGDVFSSVEAFLLSDQSDAMRGADNAAASDIIYGLGGNDQLEGRGGFDYLLGGDGDDTLIGGFGFDLSTGGAGADRFVFNNGFEGGAFALGGELITDFQSGVDKIALVGVTSGFSSFNLGINLMFQSVNGGGWNGTTTGPTLVYDSLTGGLWFDSNGNLAGGLNYLASLLNLPTLTANDFIVI